MSESNSVLEGKKLAFVGSGVMAESMISGVLEKKLILPQHIFASHPRTKRAEELQAQLGVCASTSNREAAQAADIVVICVKPQRLRAVFHELAGVVTSSQLVISIVAGANSSSIAQQLRHAAVVRVMPNTPAQIGHGISVWTCTPEVNEEQRVQVRAILSALGKELFFEEEKFVDMATAISGSGPAYVFLVMEALIDAAVHLGFSRQDARELVTETLLGSVLFAQESHRHPAELRNMVTSPAGTSAEALYQLEKGGLRTILSKAVHAAYQKTATLSDIINKG
ncbi:pyrroline-5-carboxylate reductase [Candidatus Chlorohelix allophototropha]|uniref:Pyrroline-5-carboxylate reductase n=2 Tax=Candidatus Chlorohelix allophototropha TaxID=3003348 RepID=A0ABY9B170_9CHLR|nr:pyrroline-5-carboxylate reductase [Chloroflexota bacterium L227-S17]